MNRSTNCCRPSTSSATSWWPCPPACVKLLPSKKQKPSSSRPKPHARLRKPSAQPPWRTSSPTCSPSKRTAMKVTCKCKHAFQDETLGKGIRHTTPVNKSKKDNKVYEH